jgi:anti-anti-sigma factor
MRSARRLACPVHRALVRSGETNDTVKATAGARVGPFFYEALTSFELTVERYDAVATVVVSGELDLATAPRLSAAVAEHGDARLLVLDMIGTTFIDSTGVRALLQADRRSVGSGSRLVVVAGDGAVRSVLALCELDGRLTLVSDHPAPAAEPRAVTDG